ncbi:hypothetical protein E4U21_004870 [Claviceps maximensis]|nr:hypothetical protein E4U21_004870 [Claviceps maximensis]
MAPALVLARNDKPTSDLTHGILDPHDINNVGFFVLFALIGVAFVITGIWFFFWAKNGGFHFQENDWDDYKSTVLRRKGPNGTLLSGATRSTDLGGGSVYKDVRDDEDGTTVITDSTGLSGVTAGASDIAAREKRRAKQEKRDRERRRRRAEKGGVDEKGADRHAGEDGVTDELAEKEALKQLRSYRHERPARVGGLNKESDGSQWDGSTTNASESSQLSSELVSHSHSHSYSHSQSHPRARSHRHQLTPASTNPATTEDRKKTGAAIRKVYSTADRNERREAERIRAEARRLREESRSRPSRRNFSFNRPEASESAATESLLEGSDLGVREGHLAPVPESRARRHRHGSRERERERDERRARRGGYRRGRGDDDEL